MPEAVAGWIVAGLGGAKALGVLGVALVNLTVGIATTALVNAFTRQKQTRPGIRTETRTQGSTVPQSIMLGYYATDGNLVAPEMSHRKFGNASTDTGWGVWRTHVVDLADHPIEDLVGVIVNGQYLSLADDFEASAHAWYGVTVKTGIDLNAWNDRFWVKWYDGTQTTVDSGLLAIYDSHPTRPWQSDMILRGVPYAILTFKMDGKVFQGGDPTVRFVVKGSPLHDPRTDSTVYTENPVVMIWNILRGITLEDGNVYGLRVDEAELPSAVWEAEMAICDAGVDDGDGGTEPQYRAGYEVRIANPDIGGDEPLSVIEQLLNACDGEICDFGGEWLIRCGAVRTPTVTITDDDLIVTDPQSLRPFQSMDETFNSVRASHPSPADNWNPVPAPSRSDAAAITEDGEELIADLSLPAVPFAAQVERLMAAWLADARRLRQHVITLPAEYGELTPLDSISWSSAKHGYTAKVFEIVEMVEDPRTLFLRLTLRERDPDDYDVPTYEGSVSPTADLAVPGTQTVPDWDLLAETYTDPDGIERQRLRMTFTPDDIAFASGVAWTLRINGSGEVIATGTLGNVAAGEIVYDSPRPGITYEAQADLIADLPTTPTAWESVTTSNVRIPPSDLIEGLGKNLLPNSSARQGLRFWRLQGTGGNVQTETTLRIIPSGDPYAGTAFPTFAIVQDGTGQTGQAWATVAEENSLGIIDLRAVQVRPGEYYYASIRAAAIRCSGLLIIGWRQENGTYIGQTFVTIARDDAASSTDPMAWDRVSVKSVAPANARYAHLHVYKEGTASGSDSAIYWHEPMVELTHADALAPSPYGRTALPIREDVSYVQDTDETTYSTGGVTILTLPIPQIDLGNIWRRAVQFEAKRSADGAGTMRLQVRRKAYSGDAWSGWSTAETYDIATDFATDWAPVGDTGSFSATYFDTQYRLYLETVTAGSLTLRQTGIVGRNIGVA